MWQAQYRTILVAHHFLILRYALLFVQCLLDCALLWMPLRNSGGKRSVAGWNDGTQTLKADANFWYRVWSEPGCPCLGVLFEIKKKTKRRFKYARFRGRKGSSLGVNLHTSLLTVLLEIFGLKLAGYPSQRDALLLLL